MKTGLVLEGGGVRGIYTAGVLDVFMENGIDFDGVIGVSAGAIHACSYISRQCGRSIRYYKKYSKDPRFMGFRCWLKTGDVVGADFCYRELPDELDIFDHEAFYANKTPYYVVCSNVETGEAEYLQLRDMKTQIDYLRASASLPYFSRIVELDGKKYLDGGSVDSIPIDAFRVMGYGRNVLVLTQHEGYVKKPEHGLLPKLIYRKYPAFRDALLKRHEKYNACLGRISELERAGEIFVIRPSEPLNIGRLEKDPEEIERVYNIGRTDAERRLKDMIEWKENNNELS